MTAGDPPDVGPGRKWRRVAAIVAAATIGMWALSAIALLIYTRDAREPATHELVIPAGTIDLIAAGENPLRIPSTWGFYADDVLVLRNEDTVDHRLGRYFARAGETQSYVLTPTAAGFALCTLHPDGEIAIDVDFRRFTWWPTIPPALALGPAIGLVIVASRRVMRLLDEPVAAPTQGHDDDPPGIALTASHRVHDD